ncbi:MAG: M23 family metallopeptidase [Clostridiales bacterium]|nr:M23 family metallopeptidase [Clostridiales bacterium]
MKKKLPEDSIFKKKGFFVALYSCVAVVLVLGGVISFNNLRSISQAKEQQKAIDQQIAAAEANAGRTKVDDQTGSSYQTPADQAAAKAAEQKAKDDAQKAQAERLLNEQKQAAGSSVGDNAVAFGNKTVTPAATAKPETSPEPSATVQPEKSTENADDLAAPAFEAFKDGETMDWPVLGEIVMDYSVDHVLYDKTLDQYRTNDDIRIAAKPGTPVKASFSGVVTKVESDRKNGNIVVIDNGNGWTTTYGQLMDSVLVKEGDVVKSGQVIGGVSSPTIYGVLLGNHLIFKVTKDDASIDPKTILSTRG